MFKSLCLACFPCLSHPPTALNNTTIWLALLILFKRGWVCFVCQFYFSFLSCPWKLCMWRHLLFAMIFAHRLWNKNRFWKRLKVFFLQSSAYNLLMKSIKCFIDFQRDAWRLMMTNEHLLPWWKHLFYKWCSIYWWCCSSQSEAFILINSI